MIRSVRPNAGHEAAYRKRLLRLIEKMHKSAIWWIRAEYRSKESEIAGDKSPARSLAQVIRHRAKDWQKLFNIEADKIAAWFIGNVDKAATNGTKEALKQSLPAVKFDSSRVYNNTMMAHIQENVALIKSIPEKYFSDVETLVMRSVAKGRDLKTLTDELQERYGLTRKRAALIAKDQNEKATSKLAQIRQLSLGIEFGTWRHSHAGKEPRKSHLKADKKVFRISKGMYIDGEWIMPGEKINCKCTWTPLIPGVDYPVGGKPKGFND